MLILNFIVLLFEIVFYSIFMYYSKREGKFSRYFLLFSLITIIGTIIGTDYLFSYVILVLMMLYGIKYIVRVKTTLYDMIYIVFMLLIKICIEMIVAFPISLFIKNYYFLAIIVALFKILIIILFKNKLLKTYNLIKEKWYKNNFYIRYISVILIYIFVICSIIFMFLLPFFKNTLF